MPPKRSASESTEERLKKPLKMSDDDMEASLKPLDKGKDKLAETRTRFTNHQCSILIEFMEDPVNYRQLYDQGRARGVRSQDVYGRMARFLVEKLQQHPYLVGNLDLERVDSTMVAERWRGLVYRYEKERVKRKSTGPGGQGNDMSSLERKRDFPFFDRMRALFTTNPKHNLLMAGGVRAASTPAFASASAPASTSTLIPASIAAHAPASASASTSASASASVSAPASAGPSSIAARAGFHGESDSDHDEYELSDDGDHQADMPSNPNPAAPVNSFGKNDLRPAAPPTSHTFVHSNGPMHVPVRRDPHQSTASFTSLSEGDTSLVTAGQAGEDQCRGHSQYYESNSNVKAAEIEIRREELAIRRMELAAFQQQIKVYQEIQEKQIQAQRDMIQQQQNQHEKEFQAQRERYEKEMAVQREQFYKELEALRGSMDKGLRAQEASLEKELRTLREIQTKLIGHLSNSV